MKKGRSDREKLAYMAQYVVRYPGQTDDLDQRLEKYLNLLDYETSRREFLSVSQFSLLSSRVQLQPKSGAKLTQPYNFCVDSSWLPMAARRV